MSNFPPPVPPHNHPSTGAARQKTGAGASTWIKRAVIGAVLAFLVFRAVQFGLHFKQNGLHTPPGYKELRQAESDIMSKRKGTAHGNTPEATGLAGVVSEQMRTAREAMFEKGKGNDLLLTGGDFLVFCQIRQETCVFILHVPEMRRFTDEAKHTMMELAYVTACKALDELPGTHPRRLAVATRGDLLYDKILMGDYLPQDKQPLAHASPVDLKASTGTARELLPFFLPE